MSSAHARGPWRRGDRAGARLMVLPDGVDHTIFGRHAPMQAEKCWRRSATVRRRWIAGPAVKLAGCPDAFGEGQGCSDLPLKIASVSARLRVQSPCRSRPRADPAPSRRGRGRSADRPWACRGRAAGAAAPGPRSSKRRHKPGSRARAAWRHETETTRTRSQRVRRSTPCRAPARDA